MRRTDSGPGAAVPLGEVVGPEDASCVREVASNVQVAAQNGQGIDVPRERTVARSVRAHAGPAAAVPFRDPIGRGYATSVVEAAAHVDIAAGECNCEHWRADSAVAGAIGSQRVPRPGDGRSQRGVATCEARSFTRGQVADKGPSAGIDRAGDARGAVEDAITAEGRSQIDVVLGRRQPGRGGWHTGDGGDAEGKNEQRHHERARLHGSGADPVAHDAPQVMKSLAHLVRAYPHDPRHAAVLQSSDCARLHRGCRTYPVTNQWTRDLLFVGDADRYAVNVRGLLTRSFVIRWMNMPAWRLSSEHRILESVVNGTPSQVRWRIS